MTGCSVPGCKNRTESGKPFYSVPIGKSPSERRRRLRWLLRMGRDKPAPRGTRICEDHFTDDQFEDYHQSNGRRKLRPNAVPSIFPSRGQAQSENTAASSHVLPSHEMGQVDLHSSVQHHEQPLIHIAQDDASLCIDDPETSIATSDTSANPTICTSSTESATAINSGPSISAPVESVTVPTIQSVAIAPMEQQTTILLQDTGAPTPTYTVTYLLPNHGAYRLASHVAVPVSTSSPTIVPKTEVVPCSSQPLTVSPLLPKKPPKTEREKELERRLDLERKKRRKAEMERDELRHSLKRLLADDQVRALEKGTMRGSSWSQETVNKALQLKAMCGGRVYDYVKTYVVPLPSQRTLQQLVEQMKAADRERGHLSDERECLSDEEESFYEEFTISEEEEA